MKKKFRGQVTINARDAAIHIASQDSRCRHDRLVYWTDGCGMRSGSGIGVASIPFGSETWVDGSWRTRETTDSNLIELIAIEKALQLAKKHCKKQEGTCVTHVVIYTDSHNALNLLKHSIHTREPKNSKTPALLGQAISVAAELDAAGVWVDLRWVPAHEGIGGNPRADKAARNAARQRVRKVPLCQRARTSLIICGMQADKNIDIFRN